MGGPLSLNIRKIATTKILRWQQRRAVLSGTNLDFRKMSRNYFLFPLQLWMDCRGPNSTQTQQQMANERERETFLCSFRSEAFLEMLDRNLFYVSSKYSRRTKFCALAASKRHFQVFFSSPTYSILLSPLFNVCGVILSERIRGNGMSWGDTKEGAIHNICFWSSRKTIVNAKNAHSSDYIFWRCVF